MSAQPFKPYPVLLTQLAGALCVVVGGGAVAARKVAALLDSGARVRVISPVLHPHFVQFEQAIEHVARAYAPGDLQDVALAIAATDRREVNAQVADEARLHGILHNIADDPDKSSFHTLGAVWRGDVLLAASTGGDSPALAALMRRKLLATFGPEYGVLAERLGALRRSIGATLPPAARTALWRSLATDEALALLGNGDEAAFAELIARSLAEARKNQGTTADD